MHHVRKKYSRGNQALLFNKELSKAIISRTKLRNIFLQNRSENYSMCYTKERNFCVSLLIKTKKRYYENLNKKSVADNRLLFKNVKPFLFDKVSGEERIYLIENNKLV